MTDDLDPRFRPYADWLVAVANAYVGGGTVTSTRRSYLSQASLFAEKSGVQVCPAGHSTHELGLAMDFESFHGKQSQEQAWLGKIWNTYLWPTWSPNDPVHFSPIKGCT